MATTSLSCLLLIPNQPHASATTDAAVRLLCSDGVTSFRMSRTSLRQWSRFADAILEDFDDAADAELPLSTSAASPAIVQLLSTWVDHHDALHPPAQRDAALLPLEVRTFEALFARGDPWDMDFFAQHVCPGFKMSEGGITRLYGLALLAAFLQMPALSQQCHDVIALAIRTGVRLTGDPAALIQIWLGRSEPFTEHDIHDAVQDLSDVCNDTPLRASRDS